MTQAKLQEWRPVAAGEVYRAGDQTEVWDASRARNTWEQIAAIAVGTKREAGDLPVRRRARPAPKPGTRWLDKGEDHHALCIEGPTPDRSEILFDCDETSAYQCHTAWPEDPRLATQPAQDCVCHALINGACARCGEQVQQPRSIACGHVVYGDGECGACPTCGAATVVLPPEMSPAPGVKVHVDVASRSDEVMITFHSTEGRGRDCPDSMLGGQISRELAGPDGSGDDVAADAQPVGIMWRPR